MTTFEKLTYKRGDKIVVHHMDQGRCLNQLTIISVYKVRENGDNRFQRFQGIRINERWSKQNEDNIFTEFQKHLEDDSWELKRRQVVAVEDHTKNIYLIPFVKGRIDRI